MREIYHKVAYGPDNMLSLLIWQRLSRDSLIYSIHWQYGPIRTKMPYYISNEISL